MKLLKYNATINYVITATILAKTYDFLGIFQVCGSCSSLARNKFLAFKSIDFENVIWPKHLNLIFVIIEEILIAKHSLILIILFFYFYFLYLDTVIVPYFLEFISLLPLKCFYRLCFLLHAWVKDDLHHCKHILDHKCYLTGGGLVSVILMMIHFLYLPVICIILLIIFEIICRVHDQTFIILIFIEIFTHTLINFA